MSEMKVNVPLLRKCLEHIEAHPEEWDQDCWGTRSRCGTRHCLAGWALSLSGQALCWTPFGEGRSGLFNTADGGDPFDAASAVLGLSYQQACDLFRPDNALADLWSYAEKHTGGAISRDLWVGPVHPEDGGV